MNGDWVEIGSEAKLRINGQPWAATGGNWRDTADIVGRNNTESGRKKRVKAGMEQLEMDVQAQLESDASPHISPLNLRRGQTVVIQFWPFGIGHPFGFYDIPAFLISETGGTFAVEGSALQTINFRGQSDGDYWLAGE